MIRPTIQLHNTIIGQGESTTKTILQTVLNLQDKETKEFPTPEIYSQISFPSLLNHNYKQDHTRINQHKQQQHRFGLKEDMYDYYSCYSFKPSSEFETIQEIKN